MLDVILYGLIAIGLSAAGIIVYCIAVTVIDAYKDYKEEKRR